MTVRGQPQKARTKIMSKHDAYDSEILIYQATDGKIVSTGTPAGVGPIAAGDIVEIEISGIGTLRNPVIQGCQ